MGNRSSRRVSPESPRNSVIYYRRSQQIQILCRDGRKYQFVNYVYDEDRIADTFYRVFGAIPRSREDILWDRHILRHHSRH